MSRSRIETTLVVLLATALLLIGVGAMVAPQQAAAGFGLAEAGTSSPGFVRATGARDIALGAILLLLVARRVAPPVVGACVLATALVPVVDAAVVWSAAGFTNPAAVALHATSIPCLLVLGFSLLRSAGGTAEIAGRGQSA